MSRSRVVSALFIAAVSCAVAATTGCQSKVNQCNKLIEQLNAVAKTAHDHKGDDKESWEKFAKDLEDGKKKIQTVELADEKLKGFQNDYIGMTDKMINASRKLASGAGKTDRAHGQADGDKGAQDVQAGVKEMQEALSEFEEAGKAEDKLVDAINGYCQK